MPYQTAAGAQTFTYDLADRLKTATVGATTETYAYAGDGVRLSASTGAAANQTTKYLWDRNFGLPQLAIERDGNNALLRYYRYGLDLLRETAGSTTYYYHPDGLGSAADVTSSTGTSLTWSESYPYGLVRQAGVAGSGAPAVQPFGFTGEQLDSLTGLYHLRARQYDPGTGRFLTTDPMAGQVTDPYVASYGYVRGNPVRWTDPSGKCIPWCIGAVIGFFAYTGGVIVTNVALGNSDPLAGWNVGDAAIATGAGALSGGLTSLGLTTGEQIVMNGVIGFDSTVLSMDLGGRHDPKELLVGTAFGAAGPLLPGGEGVSGAVRGTVSGIVANATQNLITGQATAIPMSSGLLK